MRIAIIGGGNMARAIIKAVIESGVVAAGDITVSDISQAARQNAAADFGIGVATDNLAAVKGADVIILAVKPQNLENASQSLSGTLEPSQLVISILAGITLHKLSASLKHGKIVRVMPNTPAQIGLGMSVWTCSESLISTDEQAVESILSSMGRAMRVDDETYIDMATAVSGSGPAYFFLFLEKLVAGARRLGFSPDQARELVLQTALGSVTYAANSHYELPMLRKQVTSPGGTTEAALKVFENSDFERVINDALTAAYRRSRQIGGY